MFNRAIQILILVLGTALVNPVCMASEGNTVSASTTFRITVSIAPTNDFNPQLSSASLMAGSKGNCGNTLEESGLSAGSMDREGEILARNFLCSSQPGQFKVAEQDDTIVLTNIPV